jgi:hypothetical protein
VRAICCKNNSNGIDVSDDSDDIDDSDEKNAMDIRAVYVSGIPPAWGRQRIRTWFERFGAVEFLRFFQANPNR